MENELSVFISEMLRENPHRLILSHPTRPAETGRKVVLIRRTDYYLMERHTEQQIEHDRLPLTDGAQAAYLQQALANGYRRLDAWTAERVHTLMISKKGKLTRINSKPEGAPPETAHDRVKRYLLPEGTLIPPLADLGIFTPEGKVVAAMHSKYRQINRFLEMIADVLPDETQSLSVVDYGCGKSYLTFVVYYYLTAVRGLQVRMTGLDLKENVINQCNAAAQKYGYDGLCFKQGDIASHGCDGADMVITLHACDTATDYALYHAVQNGARMILAAPCCQHELNGQMQSSALPLLTRYGVVRERTAALMTDAIRANMLDYCGYRTQLMEFVELTHTPKNLLIRAVKTDMPPDSRNTYREEAEALCRAFGFTPTLMRLLMNTEKI